jgi:adhesin transport system membrane fusion protein
MSTRFLEIDASTLNAAATPGWLKTPGRLLGLGIMTLVLALIFVPWVQSSYGEGQVVAYSPVDRPQEIHAPITGRVAEWHVIEGSHVEKGQLLVELIDVDPLYLTRLEENRRNIEDTLTAAQARAEAYERQEKAYEEARQLKIQSAQLKVKMAEQKLTAIDQEIEAARAQVTTTDQNIKRRRDLFQQGLVSERDVELAELDLANARAKLNQTIAKRTEIEAEKSSLSADVLRVGSEELGKIASSHAEMRKARSEEAKAREELVKLDVTLSRQRSSTITAPRSGTILWLNGHLGGNLVKAGDPLVVLVPDNTEPAAELWVDGNDVPLVQVGRKVRLQFEGWPAVQFSGWPQVAVGTFGAKVAFVDATSRQDGRFRIVLRPDADDEPWPDQTYLRQGVRAVGWVLLDEVSLGFELWRQLNGFPPSVSAPPSMLDNSPPTPLGSSGNGGKATSKKAGAK